MSPRCKNLVLDAGPLLSLSPLRGLAETYLTVPQVLDELKDKRAREHFEQLGLSTGVRIEIRTPDAASIAQVIQFAKKTGDYAVLSHADICVLALAHSLQGQVKHAKSDSTEAEKPESVDEIAKDLASSSLNVDAQERAKTDPKNVDDEEREPLDVELHQVGESPSTPSDSTDPSSSRETATPIYDDPSDEDDGEGEWITPSNVALHKSRALDLLPSAGSKSKRNANEVVYAGCMTADFAMQNVLLQMGLNLIGVEGKKIEKLKTWVLRCHACFKICKDNSKKFCPSCGNPTLLRASVTISSPNAASDAPVMQIHLKANFQYKTRGTKYSIPAPKPGSAKTGPGEGLILREDQSEYLRAKQRSDSKREREEQRMVKGLLDKGGEGGVSIGSWMDPDWIPEMMSTGTGGKGRSQKTRGRDGDMPVIGYGRKNPNERRRKA